VDRLVDTIATRCEALLDRLGHGPDGQPSAGEPSEDDDALPLIQSAAVAGRSAVRARPAALRVQVLAGRPHRLPRLCATAGGHSLHAGVVIRARDRAGLKRLAGYIARPPLAKSRLDVLPDGRVRLGLKRAWSDGTTAHVLTAEELVVPPGYPARRWARATRRRPAPHQGAARTVAPRPLEHAAVADLRRHRSGMPHLRTRDGAPSRGAGPRYGEGPRWTRARRAGAACASRSGRQSLKRSGGA
jgi:hypothetical protein